MSLQGMFPLNKVEQTAECLNLRLNKCSVHQLATNAMLQLGTEIQMSNIPPAYSNKFHRGLVVTQKSLMTSCTMLMALLSNADTVSSS